MRRPETLHQLQHFHELILIGHPIVVGIDNVHPLIWIRLLICQRDDLSKLHLVQLAIRIVVKLFQPRLCLFAHVMLRGRGNVDGAHSDYEKKERDVTGSHR